MLTGDANEENSRLKRNMSSSKAAEKKEGGEGGGRVEIGDEGLESRNNLPAMMSLGIGWGGSSVTGRRPAGTSSATVDLGYTSRQGGDWAGKVHSGNAAQVPARTRPSEWIGNAGLFS